MKSNSLKRRDAAVKLLRLPIPSASESPWTADTLRERLQALVADNGLQMIDLIEAWDTDRSGQVRVSL